MMSTLAQAAALIPGARTIGPGETAFDRVHTDTRTLLRGDCFVALRGERFDGHDHLEAAAAAGAACAIVQRGVTSNPAGRARPLPALVVEDTQQALTDFAAGWRRAHPVALAAVTGSNGKTTVTQMIAAMLRAWQGDAVLSTLGNLNNHIGLPLTLLRLRADGTLHHRVGVVELGMNHPGEIAALAALARPLVGLVNNAQREHQEFMHTVEAVARENGAVIEALPSSGVAVFPAGEEHTPIWRELAGARRTLRFTDRADDATADVRCLGATWHTPSAPQDAAGEHWSVALATPVGEIQARLHLPGRHNLRNAAAAAAAAVALGCPANAIADGLSRFRAVQGRSHPTQFVHDGRPVTLIDDSYNANPDSMRAAIDLLASLPGPHWLLIGDMGEVGDQGPRFHAEIGAHARAAGIAHLWCAGPASRHAAAAYGAGALHEDDTPTLVDRLRRESAAWPACASALVKGSRFMRMERVVAALQAPGVAAATGSAAC